jgi:F420-non-reducing hydrogenase iron-sulfur subunit
MATPPANQQPKILILASLSGGYRGADSVGQSHGDYPANTYILPMVSGAMFPETFYLQAFDKGIDAIIVMFSGTDSPFKGGPQRTSSIVNRTYTLMKEKGIDTRRLRLAAICTVCSAAFLREISLMQTTLADIGPISAERAGQPAASSALG